MGLGEVRIWGAVAGRRAAGRNQTRPGMGSPGRVARVECGKCVTAALAARLHWNDSRPRNL